jgi:hypothetical protein
MEVTYAKGHGCCWNAEEQCVDDDHVEDPADLMPAVND